jgi:dUTP pyrophosphatase
MDITVDIKRLGPDVPLPEYKTAGAVAFDIAVRESKTVPPGETIFFSTGLVVCIPQGYVLVVASRSSNAKKQIVLANGIGIIDQDYHGPTDELHLAVRNEGQAPYVVEKGERIAQGLFVPVARAAFREVETLDAPDRGAYGTTG